MFKLIFPCSFMHIKHSVGVNCNLKWSEEGLWKSTTHWPNLVDCTKSWTQSGYTIDKTSLGCTGQALTLYPVSWVTPGLPLTPCTYWYALFCAKGSTLFRLNSDSVHYRGLVKPQPGTRARVTVSTHAYPEEQALGYPGYACVVLCEGRVGVKPHPGKWLSGGCHGYPSLPHTVTSPVRFCLIIRDIKDFWNQWQ